MLKLGLLDEPAPHYAALTYPRFAPLLDRIVGAVDGPLAVAATLEGMPAGLALLSPPSRNRDRRLLSIFVTAPLRRLGIAGRLLREGESSAAKSGTTSLHAVHSTRLRSRPALEALLRGNGWHPPVEIEFRLTAECGAYEKALIDWAPLLSRLRRDGLRTVDWDAMTENDRREIAAVRENGEPLARRFDPLNPDMQEQLLPMVSVLLKCGDAIAGWVTATRGIKTGVCHYSNGYVVPSLRNHGWLIAAMCAVCERQALVFGPKSLAVFDTSPENIRMRRLMERGLAPYSLWTDIRFRTEKPLSAG